MNEDYLSVNSQGLVEVSPTASQNTQQEFIDNYRQAQAEKTAQIGEAAHALGSDLEAQYGGLHGPSDYIKSRYQTDQTESRLANLRSAAQLSALNQLMQNDLANWADKYSQARRKAVAKANTSTTTNDNKGDVDTNLLGGGTAQKSLRSSVPGTTTILNWSTSSSGEPGYDVYDSETGQRISSTNTSSKSTNNENPISAGERAATSLAQTFLGLPGQAYQLINGLLGRF